MRRVSVLGLSFALFALQPTLGGAAIVRQSYSRAAVTVSGSLIEFYDYTNAATNTWTTPADFSAGVFDRANSTDVAGSVVLDRIGPEGVLAPAAAIPWWDTQWSNRRCFSIDHEDPAAATVTEYQLHLDFPVTELVAGGFLQADGGDLRAVGAGGLSSLPLWIDDAVPDTIWVQMDTIAAGATTNLCIYYGHLTGTAAPANHTAAAVFSHTSPRPIYYTVSDRFTAPGTAIDIVSYTDANEVAIDGGAAIPLGVVGDRVSIDPLDATAGSVLSVLGPISAAGIADGFDSLVPISYAGTRFVLPISRGVQHFSFVAPFGDATVDLYDGATLADTFTVAAGTPYVHTTTDIAPANTAIIETNAPVLVTHASELGNDAVALYPAISGELVGVRSTELLIGYDTDLTQIMVATSDGVIQSVPGDRGGAISLAGGGIQGGTAADGVILTADQPIAAVGHEDGDGTESVIALPRFELGSRYWLPSDTQYVSVACPTTDSTPIDIIITPSGTPPTPVTCAGGPDIGWATDSTGWVATPARGIEVSSSGGEPFFAFYETTGDEQLNLLGLKQGRQYTWPEPVVGVGADEGIFESAGSWESATFDTGPGSGVFGSLLLEGSTPAATQLRIQVATTETGTPTDFVGPDGTAASYFTIATLPAVLDFGHDGERLLRIRAEFATSDPAAATPRLDLAGVDHHLAQLDRSLGATPVIAVPTSLTPTPSTSFLLRVSTDDDRIAGSESTAVYGGGSNLTNLATETVRFVNAGLGIDSVQQSTSLPTKPPIPFGTSAPHSVVIETAAVSSGTTELTFIWQLDYAGNGSTFIETDFVVTVIAP